MKINKLIHFAHHSYREILFAAFFSSLTTMQPLFAAEMPCVKEVCIGDGLDKLRSIKFQPVNTSRVEKLSKRKRADRVEKYGGFKDTQPPDFLILAEFDENALDDIAKIKAACSPLNELNGIYISESGHKTNIHLALWPDKSGNMEWLVKGIGRAYKGLQSRGEADQLIQDLREKYAKWDTGKVGQPKPWEAGMMLVPVREPVMTLFLAPSLEVIYADAYKKNPLCKPTRRINVD